MTANAQSGAGPAPSPTRHQWLKALEARSPSIQAMNLGTRLPDAPLTGLAYKLASHDQHVALVVRAIENLHTSGAATPVSAETLLFNLLYRNTYGAFSELAAYDWMIEHTIHIDTQISLTAADVLGVNGADIDGRVKHLSDIHFDIKGFGFNGYMVDRLKTAIEAKIPKLQIIIQDSWDLSIEDFEKCFDDLGTIVGELSAQGRSQRGPMRITAGPPQRITVSSRTDDPYLLAQENARYPFANANQFTRHKPYMLVYAVHPWLNQSTFHHNFAGRDGTFTRAFCRRAFMQFTHDTTLASTECSQLQGSSTTLGDASRQLSAIMFVNLWPADLFPAGSSEAEQTLSWIYLNPRATHKLNPVRMRYFQLSNDVVVEDFATDDY